ncbi:uncharacterized protein E5676_scaffold139G001970 [Cucumis melo var. makuwa]|uniref:Uncharacterized protein n=1 Tax=Cucumis melo var. makuwa TaxID=1194695 RepID=A0A5A7UFS7_CUCMM|nr:uncharacterized protein E6C27_scaffold344G001940 [Cucumis melo var. makuwa]TYK11531.1 uncharacterized protein E5676_scaffold139G001970 [Cucumis melo var. makuwa]
MAAPSPTLSNNSSDTATTTAGAVAANVAVSPNHLANRTGTPPKTLRGLNKPKCRVCGNVARSRCPYESCKSCCARNQNPCYIHVLKANATFPDKTPSSSSPLFDKQSPDLSSSGTSNRVASLRQLSSNFSQFNNVRLPIRSPKPVTRKDAAAINEWRFSKLREFRERHIEAENEAFDRYMKNVNLLEEVFSMRSMIDDKSLKDGPSVNSGIEANLEEMTPGLKLKLGSTSDNSRKRIRKIVEDGLRKIKIVETTDNVNEVTDHAQADRDADQMNLNDGCKTIKGSHAKRTRALGDLIEKLNKARNEEDLKSCLAMKHQLFNRLQTTSSQAESEETDTSKEQQVIKKDLDSRKELGYSLPKLINKTNIDQQTLNQIDAHFSSLKQIGNL